jgi:2'-5' RNA ligase
MRLFLGIKIPEDQQIVLYKEILPLAKKYPQFHWVQPETYHATLQFYGDVEDETKLVEMIQSVVYDKKKFHLYGRSIDLFPTQELVLHMAYVRQHAIDTIVDELEAAYPSFIKQRSFVFHTSIARAKRSSKQQYFHLRKQLDHMTVSVAFEVAALTLFASGKNMEGRKYQVIKEFPLL